MLGSDTLRFGLEPGSAKRSSAERLDEERITAGERRRSGRTRRMIEGLPASGSIVIVHSPAAIGIFRDVIRELRGDEVAARTRVVAAPTLRDENAILRGVRLPAFRDHFVDEQREHARAVMQAWRP